MNADPPSSSGPSLDDIATDFMQRLRQGQHPSIEAFAEAHPQFEQEIRDLFPTLVTLEQNDPLADQPRQNPLHDYQPPRQLGEYKILREIGRGGMGIVYEAEHQTMQRRVALKVLPASIKPVYVQRFLREARSAGQLHHTNIVPVFEVGQHAGVHYYAMQYIHGDNLDAVIEELRCLVGLEDRVPAASHSEAGSQIARDWLSGELTLPLSDQPPRPVPPPKRKIASTTTSLSGGSQWSQVDGAGEDFFRRAAQVGIQVAEALQYAHEHGVLHRDIKPSNLILDTDGVVWVTDFGLAQDEGDQLTGSGDIVGTLRYMAPERFQGTVDARSEVYSLGLTLYELCTLEPAFSRRDRAQLVQQICDQAPPAPRRVRPEIPVDLETVIVKAIAREPAARYATPKQLAADLRRFLSDRPVLARRVSMTEKAYRWARRHPARAALLSCLTLIGLILVGGSMYLAQLDREHAKELTAENQKVRAEKQKVEEANQALERANLSSRAHLYYSYLGNAEATQASRRQGRNFFALDAVGQAAAIVPTLGLTPAKAQRRHFALRSVAVAAMSQWDVRTEHQWQLAPGWQSHLAADFVNQRIAHSDPQGQIAIRPFGQSEPVMTLPAIGQPAWVPMFSPDGKYLVTRYHSRVQLRDPVTILWEVDRGREVIRSQRFSFNAWCQFSNDSQQLAVPTPEGLIQIYNTHDGSLALEFNPGSAPTHLAFANKDQHLIVVREEEPAIEFWRLAPTPTLVRQIPFEGSVTALDWNEPRQQLAVGSEHDLWVWPANLGEGPPTRIEGHQARVVRLELHPQGKLVMSSAWDGTTRMFDLAAGQEVLRMEGPGLAFTGFSRQGDRIAFAGPGPKIGIWQLPQQLPVTVLQAAGEMGGRRRARFLPGRPQWLAYPSADGTEFWHHPTERRAFVIPSGETRDVVFDPSGERLYTSGQQGLQAWDLAPELFAAGSSQSALQELTPEVIFAAPTRDIALDAKGSQLATIARNHQALIIDLDDGSQRSVGPHTNIADCEFSPDGKCLITSTWQGSGVKVWKLEEGILLRDLAPTASNATLTVDPSDHRLVVVTPDRRMVWDTQNWNPIWDQPRAAPDEWPGDSAVSPDGRWLIATYSRHVPQLIDLSSETPLTLLSGPVRTSLGGLDWSDDGRYVSVAYESTIQVWDLTAIQSRLAEWDLDWTNRRQRQASTNQATSTPASHPRRN